MALLTQIKSLDEVEKSLQQYYTQVGDVYVLDTDDGDFKNKLSEFRNNNVELLRKVDELTKTASSAEELREKLKALGGIDPAEAVAAVEKMQAIQEKKLIDEGDIEKVVAQRVEAHVKQLKSNYEGQIEQLTSNLEEVNGKYSNTRNQLQTVVIDSELTTAINNTGNARKGAMQDLLRRGREVFVLSEDGKPVPMQGENVMYGKDGKNPMSMDEWAQSVVLDAPYLFEDSAGGGAKGGKGGSDKGAGRIVDGSDPHLGGASLEEIASGEVEVQV